MRGMPFKMSKLAFVKMRQLNGKYRGSKIHKYKMFFSAEIAEINVNLLAFSNSSREIYAGIYFFLSKIDCAI